MGWPLAPVCLEQPSFKLRSPGSLFVPGKQESWSVKGQGSREDRSLCPELLTGEDVLVPDI